MTDDRDDIDDALASGDEGDVAIAILVTGYAIEEQSKRLGRLTRRMSRLISLKHGPLNAGKDATAAPCGSDIQEVVFPAVCYCADCGAEEVSLGVYDHRPECILLRDQGRTPHSEDPPSKPA